MQPLCRYTLTLLEGRTGVITDVLHFYNLLALLDYIEEHKKKTYTITKKDLKNSETKLICDNSRGGKWSE